MTYNLHSFNNEADLIDALSADILRHLNNTLATNKRASWAVSGGNSPKGLFAAINQKSIDWQRVDICLIDERFVDEDHPRSNAAMIKKTLLQNKAKDATFVPLFKRDCTLEEAPNHANNLLNAVQKPFSSVLLGMGPDGHTASLFPNADGLEEAFANPQQKDIMAIKALRSDITGDETQRLSMTPHALKEADHLALLLLGESKLKAFEDIIQDQQFPITRLVALLDKPLNVYYTA